jgi:glutamine synthetase
LRVGDERGEAIAQVLDAIRAQGLTQVRIAWCDLHGVTRSKTLTARAVPQALRSASAWSARCCSRTRPTAPPGRCSSPAAPPACPALARATTWCCGPTPPASRCCPGQGTGWLRAQPFFPDGQPVPLDTRTVLQRALQRLAQAGFGLRCGLEVEFHIYRIDDTRAMLDPQQAAWPGEPPAVSMVHPGYQLLSEAWADLADAPLRIVQHTAEALGLPLLSLEVEMGPSQVEAVFDVTDALAAADQMVLFRNAVRRWRCARPATTPPSCAARRSRT